MTRLYLPVPIVLEGRDLTVMTRYSNNSCRRCKNEFKEGDVVVRIGRCPTKYYHKNCFKQY